MTLDGVLALVGIIIAAYQIMARSRRLDFHLRFGLVAWIVVLAGSAAILYVNFYPVFDSFGLTPRLELSRRGVTSERATLIVVLIVSGFLVLYFRASRLSPRRLVRFQQLLEELLSSDLDSELISLVDRHLDRLNRIARGDLILSRLRSRLTKRPIATIELVALMPRLNQGQSDEVALPPRGGQKLRSHFRRTISHVGDLAKKIIAALLPAHDGTRSTAARTLRFLLSSRRFADAVADLRPYFVPRILNLSNHEIFTFQDHYFRALLGKSGSAFYDETWACSQTSAFGAYIHPSNQLLWYLFHDARVAERLAVYKPVGEAMLSELARLARSTAEDQYNLASDRDFKERGQRDSPLHAGVLFFDIMIMSALHQGVTWHMWLYYFTHVTEAVVRNHRPRDVLIEPLDEYPTRYEHLLYEMFSSMKRWVLAVKEMPEEQENVRVSCVDTGVENENIPKSAILAMSESLRYVLLSPTIFPQTKSSLADLVVDLYFELRATSSTVMLGKVLLIALAQGGSWKRQEDASYRSELQKALAAFDTIPYPMAHVSELRSALGLAR